MKLVKHGKTKDVYLLENGNYLLDFKDTVTGHPTGESDPGGNVVIGSVAGVGANALKVSKYYFELLKSKGVKSHYVRADLSKGHMEVRPATPFGAGLEFVLRYIATGSFFRRYGAYCKDGEALNPAVYEVTLKDDGRDDPPATEGTLAALKLLTSAQYRQIERGARKVCGIVKDDLAARGIQLYDIKVEYGLVDDKVTLIDEISAGNMRAYKNGKKLSYEELSNLIN